MRFRASMRRLAALSFAVLVLPSLADPARAVDDVESWTDVELSVLQSDRIAWSARGVARVRDSLENLYDRRVETDVDLVLSDLVSVTVGYVLLNRAPTGVDFGWDHRVRAGLTYPLLRRDVRVEGTTLYERHIGQADVPDFNRYRQQVEVERPRARLSPWFHQGVAIERRGFMRSRSRMGVRWSFAPGHSMRGAYQYERIRVGAIWQPRHAIYSEWSFTPGARNPVAR